MYLRFAVNSHVHNQRHRITLLEPPQNFSSIVYFSKGFWPLSDMLADQMYYTRNSFGLVKSLFKVTLNQKVRGMGVPESSLIRRRSPSLNGINPPLHPSTLKRCRILAVAKTDAGLRKYTDPLI